MASEALVERYLLLGLRLGKLIPGLVDAYYGPDDLSTRVDGEEPPDPAALVAEASWLLDDLDGSIQDRQRARWLRAQIVGLETVARRLAGDDVAYVDEVERCYGIRPALVPEDEFARAHDALDEALPGDGPVRERFQAWERAQVVERDVLMPAFETLTAELRARTLELFELPDGESVKLELVQDEPWLAFNYYRGGLRSRVVFNTDLPWRATDLLPVVSHELYPGHHTEHVLKEELLVRGRGQLEEAIFMVGTPQSLLSEAAAMVAPEVIADGRVEGLSAELLGPLGIAYEAETAAAVSPHAETLAHVSTNVSLLLHAQGLPFDDVRAYARRWSLRSDERIEQGLRFVTDATWRAYAFCYTEGLHLARAFVAGDRLRLRRLLTEQLVPSDLA